MSRPLDPEHTDSLALTLRITRPLADALDAELARFLAANPGAPASRASIARIALMRAFLPTGAVLASASAPAPLVAVAPVAAPEAPAVAVAPAALAPEAPAERVERASRVVPAVASAPVVDPRQRQLPTMARAANDAPVSKSTPALAPSDPSADVDALAQNDALRVRYRAGIDAGLFTPREAREAIGVPESWLRGWAKGEIKKASAERFAALKRFLAVKRVPA